MLIRVFAVLLSLLATATANENPFVTKFGGPYTSVDPIYRKAASQYGILWMKVFSTLGAKDIQNKELFLDFCRTEADPMLAKLSPKSEEERKIKEAALYLRSIFAFIADPDNLSPEERKQIEDFLISTVPSGKEQTLASRLENALIRYQEFIIGMSMEEAQRRASMQSPNK